MNWSIKCMRMTVCTTIDYVLAGSTFAPYISRCEILERHLNVSDHLPISLDVNLSVTVSPPPAPGRRIDWTMAIKNGDVANYERRVEVVTQTSMNNIINGDVDLNCEIMTVASKMVDIATETLPLRKVRRHSPYIRDGLLKRLCKEKSYASPLETVWPPYFWPLL